MLFLDDYSEKTPEELRDIFSEENRVQKWLDFEAA